VCSDYPANAKLAAMGIERYFDCVVAAQDQEVGCFKPNPRILEVALDKLSVAPADALYAGDRPDGDGGAASRAGMRYVNIVYTPSGAGITIDALLASLRKG
jgi:FMN phosphatase YigB (HAD superfamily)